MRVALLFAMMFMVACAPLEPQKPAPHAFGTLPSEEQQIYLALYRHMFAHWQQNKFSIPTHFYISLQGSDAPEDLLKRLSAEGYVVEPGFRYRERHGILCSTEMVHFQSPSRASVRGGYLFGSLGGEWGPFILEKRHGIWTIISWNVDEMA